MTRSFQPYWPPIPKAEQAWRRLAQRYAALTVEIGAGVGFHPIHYAKTHPDTFTVGIEKTSEKFQKMQRRLEHHALDNVLAVHANAIQWVSQNLFDEEVSQYFILYPNPYPKPSQSNKRFTQMPFMQKLWQTLKVGGQLCLATNEEFYYLEALESWQSLPFLKILKLGEVAQDATPRTHFEKKYLARGEQCWHCVVEKIARFSD